MNYRNTGDLGRFGLGLAYHLTSKFFSYLFYRVYRWQLQSRLVSTKDSAAQVATISIGLLIVFYVFAVITLCGVKFPLLITKVRVMQGVAILLFLLTYGGVQYFFVRSRRYEQVITKFESQPETSSQTFLRGFLLVLAFIFPLVVIGVTAYFIGLHRMH